MMESVVLPLSSSSSSPPASSSSPSSSSTSTSSSSSQEEDEEETGKRVNFPRPHQQRHKKHLWWRAATPTTTSSLDDDRGEGPLRGFEPEQDEEAVSCDGKSKNQKRCRKDGKSSSKPKPRVSRTANESDLNHTTTTTTAVPGRLPPTRFHPAMSPPRSTMSPDRAREIERQKFFQSYNAMEGIVTAVVLGGFFAFVCLLVVYKTKCKPMWKNRKKRLTNTPATQSMADGENSYGCGVPPHPPFGAELEDGIAVDASGDEGDGGGGVCCGEDAEEEEEEEYDYECIPLKSMFTDPDEEDDDVDIYFLDEYGNYVFPVASPAGGVPGGGCSCPPSAEELGAVVEPQHWRRPSQASAISNAWTVKSLPGAMLYIPLLSARSVSLSSIRRSLSDPQIHFSPPFGHPIILTVNPSTDSEGTTLLPGLSGASPLPYHPGLVPPAASSKRSSHKLQQRSFSIQPDAATSRAHREFTASFSAAEQHSFDININVIQPTPSVSPAVSLKSFSGEGEGLVSGGSSSQETSLTAPGGGGVTPAPPAIAFPPPSPSLLKRRSSALSKVDRRVSFSEDSADQDERANSRSDSINSPRPYPLQSSSLAVATGNSSSNIPFMNYLQVPGQQQSLSFVVPQLSPEAQLAQTSPQARKRRATRLMKTGSFCSINSEGDGDIFGPNGELKTPEKTKRKESCCDSGGSSSSDVALKQGCSATSTPPSNNKSTFDPLSDYTEFQDDCRSDISDLFGTDDTKLLQAQGTLSDQGSIKSLSLDKEEVGFYEEHDDERTMDNSEPTVVRRGDGGGAQPKKKRSPPYNNPEYDEIMQHHVLVEDDEEEMYASSSCSISMGSDCDLQLSHQITVPVTIEHPPPEMRCCSPEEDLEDDEEEETGEENPLLQQASAGGNNASSSSANSAKGNCDHNSAASSLVQTTVHTDSGLDTEDIVPASPPQGRVLASDSNSAQISNNPAAAAQDRRQQQHRPSVTQEELDEGVRMVLVRDIGVQVTGDSPNLNSTRRFPHHNMVLNTSSSSQQTAAAGPSPYNTPQQLHHSLPRPLRHPLPPSPRYFAHSSRSADYYMGPPPPAPACSPVVMPSGRPSSVSPGGLATAAIPIPPSVSRSDRASGRSPPTSMGAASGNVAPGEVFPTEILF